MKQGAGRFPSKKRKEKNKRINGDAPISYFLHRYGTLPSSYANVAPLPAKFRMIDRHCDGDCDYHIFSYSVRFLPISPGETIPCDLFHCLGFTACGGAAWLIGVVIHLVQRGRHSFSHLRSRHTFYLGKSTEGHTRAGLTRTLWGTPRLENKKKKIEQYTFITVNSFLTKYTSLSEIRIFTGGWNYICLLFIFHLSLISECWSCW